MGRFRRIWTKLPNSLYCLCINSASTLMLLFMGYERNACLPFYDYVVIYSFLFFGRLYTRSPISCPCRNPAVGLQLIVGKDCVFIGSHTDHGISRNEEGTQYFVAYEAGNCKPGFRGEPVNYFISTYCVHPNCMMALL